MEHPSSPSTTEPPLTSDLSTLLTDDILITFPSKKWKEKTSYIDSLISSITTNSSYTIDNYTLLTEFIILCLNDPNINVNISLLTFLITLTPLERNSNNYKSLLSTILLLIVDKYKIKKDKLSELINSLLTFLLKYSLTIGELLYNIKSFPNDKSIVYKSSITEFIFVNLRKTKLSVVIECIEIIINVFSILIKDTNLDVKNCALSTLALVRKRVGRKRIELSDVDQCIGREVMEEIEQIARNVNYDRKYDDVEIEIEDESDEEVEIEEIEEEVEEEYEDKLEGDKEGMNCVYKGNDVRKNGDGLYKEELNECNNNINHNTNTNNNDIFNTIIDDIDDEQIQQQFNNDKQKDKFNLKQKIAKLRATQKAEQQQQQSSKINDNNTNNTNISSTLNEQSSNELSPQIPIHPLQFNTEPYHIELDTSIHQNQHSDNVYSPIAIPKTSSINEFERKLTEAMKNEELQQQRQQTLLPSSYNPTLLPSYPKQFNRTEEDLEYTSRISEIYTNYSELFSYCDNPKWDEKKKGFTLLNAFIQENKSLFTSSKVNQETIFNYIRIKLNNFKETNINLIKEAYLCYLSLFQIPIQQQYLNIFLKSCYEKISEQKLKETFISLLTTSIDHYSLHNVLTQLFSLINNNKKAKIHVLKEYALFFEKVIEDYYSAINTIDIKPLLIFAVNLANNTNPQARSASICLICSLYKYIGDDIKLFLKDIKESTLKIIEQEMLKVTVITHKQQQQQLSTKQSKSEIVVINKQSNKELITRCDISKQITPQLIEEINNGKWNDKKEAIEIIHKILLNANNKILPNGLKELFSLIRNKLNDGNKNIVRLIIQLLTQLIEALGHGLKQYTKLLAIPLVSNLADKQSLLRDDCINCIDKWITCYNYESIACCFGQVIKNENFELRSEVLKLLLKYKDKYKEQGFNSVMFFKEISMPFLLCLQDKSNTIRSQTEELIVISLQYIQIKHYFNQVSEFKPAIANTLTTILKRLQYENNIIDDTIIDDSECIYATNVHDKGSVNNNNNNVSVNNNNNNESNLCKKVLSKKKREDIKPSKTPTRCKTRDRLETTIDDNSNNIINKSMINQSLSTTPNKHYTKSKTKLTKTKPNRNISKSPCCNNNNNTNRSDHTLTSNSTIISNKNTFQKKQSDNNPNTNSTVSSSSSSISSSSHQYQSIFLSHYKSRPNVKDRRCENDKKTKFNIESNNFEYFNKIKETLKLVFTSDQINNMYNTDIKKNIISLTLLNQALLSPKTQPYIIDNLDLILKYFAWKLCTNQNSALAKIVFEFCDNLYNKVNDLKLNDIEINVLFNLFCDKLVSSVSTLKEKSRNLLAGYIGLTTQQKAFKMLLSIAYYKPNKTKCDIIAYVFTIYSTGEINDCCLKKNCNAVMKLYVRSDNIVRNNLINLIKELYRVVKKEIYKYCFELNEKELQNLQMKIQGNEEDDVEEEEEEIEEEEECEIEEIKENEIEDDEIERKEKRNESDLYDKDINNNNSNNNKYNAFTSNVIKQELVKRTKPITQNQLDTILSNLLNPQENIIETILALNEEIYVYYSINQPILDSNSNHIFSVFIEALTILFSEKTLQVKITKYITNVLCKISYFKSLISPLSYSVLKSTIILILNGVLYDNLGNLGVNNDGPLILRNLNLIMYRIIEYCDKTNILSILIEQEKINRNTQTKLAEFSARCIRRITEGMEKYIHLINVSKILINIHEFFISYEETQPDLQIKTQTDQLIIITLKGLLSAITKLLGDKIIVCYNKGVELHKVKDKYIKRWIKSDLDGIMKAKCDDDNDNGNGNGIMLEEVLSNRNPKLKKSSSDIQHEKLSQLKQKLHSINKGTSFGQINPTTHATKAQYKSFNQIQKKWKDVINKTQRNDNTSSFDNHNNDNNKHYNRNNNNKTNYKTSMSEQIYERMEEYVE